MSVLFYLLGFAALVWIGILFLPKGADQSSNGAEDDIPDEPPSYLHRRPRLHAAPTQHGNHYTHVPSASVTLKGHCWVIDGDTIVIDKVHIRLAGIDAPELDHPWGKQAKFALINMCKGQVITAITDGSVSHERAVAQCLLPDGRDLSAEMVKAGLALDWPKYSGGKYRHLEAPDARKRLWRAKLRQQGKMPIG